jgi:hypothetical protein
LGIKVRETKSRRVSTLEAMLVETIGAAGERINAGTFTVSDFVHFGDLKSTIARRPRRILAGWTER